jgi:hypothetical protein
LVDIVDAAQRALITEPPVRIPHTLDPYAILGLEPRATAADAHVAYRRLATLVHPDAGGTDELFRVVATAYRSLTEPRHNTRSRTRHTYRHRPPERPPPPGPFRPRAAPRKPEPAWRSCLDVASAVSALVVAIAAVAFLVLHSAARPAGPFLAVAGTPALLSVLRPVVSDGLRAGVRLRQRRPKADSRAAPLDFLCECCLDAPVGRERDERLFGAYLAWCGDRGAVAVPPWVFVEELRAQGLLYIRQSAWEGGLWVGVQLRDGVRTSA